MHIDEIQTIAICFILRKCKAIKISGAVFSVRAVVISAVFLDAHLSQNQSDSCVYKSG